MTKHKKHIQDKSNFPGLFNQLADEDQKQLAEVWEKSKAAVIRNFELSGDEIEHALLQVHTKAGHNRYNYGNEKHKFRNRILAAAILLIVFGSAYLLYPVKTTVPYGEIAKIELPDGSEAELNSGSVLSYSRLFSLLNRDITLNGEAFFTVQENSIPFRVFANGSVVEVKGTRFNVRSWDDEPNHETSITVEEGQVLFYPENRRELFIELNRSETGRWNPNLTKPSGPQFIDTEEISAWRSRMLVFNNKPLLVIFKELERRFDIQIRPESGFNLMDTLTAYYTEPLNPGSIIEDICRVKGLQFSKTANGYRIYK